MWHYERKKCRQTQLIENAHVCAGERSERASNILRFPHQQTGSFTEMKTLKVYLYAGTRLLFMIYSQVSPPPPLIFKLFSVNLYKLLLL